MIELKKICSKIALCFTVFTIFTGIDSVWGQESFMPNIINTEKDEYGITFITKDWICFTRSGLKNTLYLSKKLNGIWTMPVLAPFSGEFDDEYPRFSPKTNKLYFSSRRPYAGQTKTNFTNDIWYVELIDGINWSKAKHLGGNFSTVGIDSGAMEFEEMLYFHSDRSGKGLNFVDIYKLNINSKDDTPTKLNINSNKVDGEPFIFMNGRGLLFMSAGHGSVGKSDLFLSIKKNNVWQTPISIDLKGIVNTTNWEYSPTLDPDIRTLYFTRIVNGQADIYHVRITKLKEFYQRIKNIKH